MFGLGAREGTGIRGGMCDGEADGTLMAECGDGAGRVCVLSAGLSAARRSGGDEALATAGDWTGSDVGLILSNCVGNMDIESSPPTSVGAGGFVNLLLVLVLLLCTWCAAACGADGDGCGSGGGGGMASATA